MITLIRSAAIDEGTRDRQEIARELFKSVARGRSCPDPMGNKHRGYRLRAGIAAGALLTSALAIGTASGLLQRGPGTEVQSKAPAHPVELPRILVPHVPLAAAPEPESSRYALGAERAYAVALRIETGLEAAAGPKPSAPAMTMSW